MNEQKYRASTKLEAIIKMQRFMHGIVKTKALRKL